jgi:hypothetical protein
MQRFASVIYVSASTAESNAAVRSMIDSVLQDIHVAATVKVVETEAEVMRFCVVDYVPFTAMGFYRDSLAAYQSLKRDPRYDIHPELAS